jgi:hypothetical protein
LAARIVALRFSGALIPIPLFANEAHPFAPLADLDSSKDRCPHFASDGPWPGGRFVKDSPTVHPWIAEADLLPGNERA